MTETDRRPQGHSAPPSPSSHLTAFWWTTLLRWLGMETGVGIRAISESLAPDPGEEEIVARAVPARRAEFAAGRAAARDALARIGCQAGAILKGPLHEPLWPSGTVGSITHDGGWACAVAAPARHTAGLGVDLADTTRQLGGDMDTMILSADELARAKAGDSRPLLTVFSAKEAVVKAVSRHLGAFIDLRTITVTFPDEEHFEARLVGHDAPIHGWWSGETDFILSAARLPYGWMQR